MAKCVRNVYDNDKKYYALWPEAPWMLHEALGFSLPSL